MSHFPGKLLLTKVTPRRLECRHQVLPGGRGSWDLPMAGEKAWRRARPRSRKREVDTCDWSRSSSELLSKTPEAKLQELNAENTCDGQLAPVCAASPSGQKARAPWRRGCSEALGGPAGGGEHVKPRLLGWSRRGVLWLSPRPPVKLGAPREGLTMPPCAPRRARPACAGPSLPPGPWEGARGCSHVF